MNLERNIERLSTWTRAQADWLRGVNDDDEPRDDDDGPGPSASAVVTGFFRPFSRGLATA